LFSEEEEDRPRVRRRLRRGAAAGDESLSGRAFLETRHLPKSRAIGASLISSAAAVPRPARGIADDAERALLAKM
jgi:hypothetical protein